MVHKCSVVLFHFGYRLIIHQLGMKLKNIYTKTNIKESLVSFMSEQFFNTKDKGDWFEMRFSNRFNNRLNSRILDFKFFFHSIKYAGISNSEFFPFFYPEHWNSFAYQPNYSIVSINSTVLINIPIYMFPYWCEEWLHK